MTLPTWIRLQLVVELILAEKSLRLVAEILPMQPSMGSLPKVRFRGLPPAYRRSQARDSGTDALAYVQDYCWTVPATTAASHLGVSVVSVRSKLVMILCLHVSTRFALGQ